MTKIYSRDATGVGMYQFNNAWLALRDEDVIEPALPIIDPHHHLWDRDNRYLFHDLLDDTGSGHNVRATVYIQCRSMYRANGSEALAPVGETEFVNGVAAMSASGHYGDMRACAGIVGHADLRLGARVRDVLEAHMAASSRFRGIRYSTPWDEDVRLTPVRPPQGIMADATWREGFGQLAPLGLSYDALLFHTQLGELADLARAFPQTTIVLNHVGCPIGIGPYANRRDEVFAAWRASIGALARCENVVVKLGGLGMHVFGFRFDKRPDPPLSAELADAWRPYVDVCIEAFGPRRAMFESNFPVDKISCSYKVIWNALKRLASGYRADEKAALFHDTAARVYRLAD
ncbi:MAG TPA: amidohydrolase family protein [Xanthobacteraceae bacterium]|nr:amidohydrolase family protein [Xanthobacteraceae bacterium]